MTITICGPVFTYSLCILVLIGVVLGVGIILYSKVKPLSRKSKIAGLITSSILIIIGLALLWFV